MTPRARTLSLLPALILAALVLGFVPDTGRGPAAEERAGDVLVVLATASNRGEVAPCG